MARISLAGHICVDLKPQLGATVTLDPGRLTEVGPLAITLGGSVANTARTLSSLGSAVTAYANVGSDELGVVVQERLGGSLVTPRIRVHQTATSYSLVLEPDGADRSFWHHAGANVVAEEPELDFVECDLLHIGYPSLLPRLVGANGRRFAALLARARRNGVSTSVDLAVVDRSSAAGAVDWSSALRRITAEADVITPSVDDLASALGIDRKASGPGLAQELAETLISWGAAVVVISDGPAGLVLRTGDVARLRRAGRALSSNAEMWADQSLQESARPVTKIVTTNGAGDASSAGILFGIAEGLSPAEALRVATACSAGVLSGHTVTTESANSDTVLRTSVT